MYGRQKVLLYVLSQLKHREMPRSKTYVDKFLFVLGKETNVNGRIRFYDFYPHLYGPFSNQFYLDIADLQSRAIIDDGLNVISGSKIIDAMVTGKVKTAINERMDELGHTDIRNYVYSKYPEYTIRSKLKTHPPTRKEPHIFSIGYEGHTIDSFLNVLIQNGIDTVIDIRFNPFSMNFMFTKSKLSYYLAKCRIGYVHIPELGIDGRYRRDLKTDSDYERLFDFYSSQILPMQKDRIREIEDRGRRKRVAMLCFEHEKDHCHRGIVGSIIEKHSISVTHL